MVTSPLGLVPRDLEEVWPAGHYDIPVTGDWTQDEVNRVQNDRCTCGEEAISCNHQPLGFDYNCDVPIIDTRRALQQLITTCNDWRKRLQKICKLKSEAVKINLTISVQYPDSIT